MALAFDFGTSNSVVVCWNEVLCKGEAVMLPNLTRTYPLRRGGNATVIPSLIHYGKNSMPMIGAQVEEAGLAKHPGTFRWLKMDVLRTGGANRGRRVNGEVIYPRKAADELVDHILMFVRGHYGDLDDELVVTVPVEAFDHYLDWLQEAALKRFPGGVRFLDEATACIMGYLDQILDHKPYCIIDFGGGTLDVSVVRTDLSASGNTRCRVLGRAGEEIGGIMVDNWLLEYIQKREGLDDEDISVVGSALLRQIEQAKISISNGKDKAEISQYNDISGLLINCTLTREVLQEALEKQREPNKHNLYQILVRTLDRALDQARDRAGIRKTELEGVFLVGGSSMLPGIHEKIRDYFPDSELHGDNPFEAVALGACRYGGGMIEQALAHDYCMRSWNRELRDFELVPVVPRGTPYPTEKPVTSKYIKAACDAQQVLGLVIYERSVMERPVISYVNGAEGLRPVREEMRQEAREKPLNPDDHEFIHADPPSVVGERRFIAGFGVDEHRRLTLWLRDNLEGNKSFIQLRDGTRIPLPVANFPVVKL